MGFAIGLVVGFSLGFLFTLFLFARYVVRELSAIDSRIMSYKESVDKSVGLVYEVAEQNKKLQAAKKEREFMDKMLKGEPGPDDWRSL